MTRMNQGPPGGKPGPAAPASAGAIFDPAKPEHELYDSLAEKQARLLMQEINSAQLRRFFGEIKDLYRRYNALVADVSAPEAREEAYRRDIEPLFKMIRSKLAYAYKNGKGKIPQGFKDFLSAGIEKVHTASDFRKFVLHVEATVGFMYGIGSVRDGGR